MAPETPSKIFRRPVDGANYAFSKGFRVFPVKSNDKEPAFPGWQEWAMKTDSGRISDTGRANPLQNWGIYCGGSGLLILDIDVKKGRNGLATLEKLEATHGTLPRTFTVRTPTGGIHKYFTGEGRNSTGLLGEGLDTRGIGGYVLAPGSRINEKTYEVIDDTEAAPVPEWILQELLKRREPEVLQEGVPVPEGRRNDILASLAGTMRKRGMGFEAILAALEVVNIEQVVPPLAQHEVENIARSISKYAPDQAEIASDFLDVSPISFFRASAIDPAQIPARDWIMDHRYMAGFLSVVVSAGGVGKSMLTMLDAVSVASGRNLTGFNIVRPGPVWIYNLEDPVDELKRRMAAICMHYAIPLKTLDNVLISSGQDHPFVIAKADPQKGIVINQTAIDNATNFIREHGIVLTLMDPFVRIHECEENQNMQVDKVAAKLSSMAVRTKSAFGVVHHSSKAGANAEPGDMNVARGASALVNAARIAHTINTMTAAEAKKFAVAEARRRWYFRFDNAKANMQPPAERADWYERRSVLLPNSDSVGIVEKVDLKEIRKEKETEAEAAERRDIGDCLYEMMKPGDIWQIDHTALMISKDPKFTHLFEGHSTKYVHEKLLNWLNKYTPMQIRNKEFFVDHEPKRRPKYMLKCVEYDVNAALEEALK